VDSQPTFWLGKLEAVVSHDHLPIIHPSLRRVRTPLGSLILAAIASALCGLILHPQGFAVSAGLLVVIVLGITWPWLAVRGLSGVLSFDRDRTRERIAIGARLTLRNRLPWSAWGLILEGTQVDRTDRDGPGEAVMALAVARGWKTTEVRWEFVPECRGVYPVSLPRITTGFPFGLRNASRRLNSPQRLAVWPRTFPVGPIPEVTGGRSSEGFAPRDLPGTSGDILGVRPYRRGDSLRRIHWPQSARHDRLVICELQAHAVPRVQVVLDTDPAAHAGSGPFGSREWSIRVAASFLERWIEQGAEVEAVFDGRTLVPSAGSIAVRRGVVLDALARIGPGAGGTLADLLDLPACCAYQEGLRVVVTTDRGLRRLPLRPARSLHERFVVLKATAFTGEPSPVEVDSLPVIPWIWIDDADRVPQAIRTSWKEVAL
jgi:uncharacterized protein (DUF58 family)